MNWAPYPLPTDDITCLCVRFSTIPANWEIFLGDLEGGEPVRLTFNDSFDGFPSISPDGTKMAVRPFRKGRGSWRGFIRM